MIDIHSHTIFAVDDGAPALAMSIEMLQAAYCVGISTIIATPHFSEELYESKMLVNNFEVTATTAKENRINLIKGYEVKIDPMLPRMIENGLKVSLNQSPFILIEMPLYSVPLYAYKTLYQLFMMNMIPIIAHPERNRNFIKNQPLFNNFCDLGCLMQVNAASIMGFHGIAAKAFAKKIIRSNQAHFIASDAHNPKEYSDWYSPAYKKVKIWVGDEYTEKLFNLNALEILKSKGSL